MGALDHVEKMPNGDHCTPHLPTDKWKLEVRSLAVDHRIHCSLTTSLQDTIAVPAERGDLVVFSIHTVHGSYINTTKQPRRLVRIGYRDPRNVQTAGQSFGRPGLMVQGYRERKSGQGLFSQD